MENLAGATLTDGETKLLECYRVLSHVLMGHRDELPPFAERGAINALSALWQVVNGLDMDPGQVDDLGA
jgi:hypothetical protein